MNLKKSTKKYLFSAAVLFFLFVDITKEKISPINYRYRIKLGFPFTHKKTYILIDKNTMAGDIVVHIFDYNKELAYQFYNGKYTYTVGLYDVS